MQPFAPAATSGMRSDELVVEVLRIDAVSEWIDRIMEFVVACCLCERA
jgi:hypothetical protein